MNNETRNTLFKGPVYIVLFSPSNPNLIQEPPIVEAATDDLVFTAPHGMARDVATTLPALWFCLHLPPTFYETLDRPLGSIIEGKRLSLGHHIWLAPITAFTSDYIENLVDRAVPVAIITPDSNVEQVHSKAGQLRLTCPILKYSDLNAGSLNLIWNYVRSYTHTLPTEQLNSTITLSDRIDTAPTHLPLKWLARQMGSTSESEPTTNEEIRESLERHLYIHLLASSLSTLEDKGADRIQADELLPEQMRNDFFQLKVPGVLSFPGVPSIYSRRAFTAEIWRKMTRTLDSVAPDDTWKAGGLQDTDEQVERTSIAFLCAHRAIARTGIGLALPSVPQQLFEIVDKIERHCIHKGNGRVVWKLLDRLDEAAKEIWTEQLQLVVNRSSHLTVFSNFPIGLLRAPGTTAPILAHTPISQYPVLPLTRAVQQEVSQTYSTTSNNGRVRVLVAECIPADDPVGMASRQGWDTVQNLALEQQRPLDVEIVDIDSEDTLRQTLAESSHSILVISAHGFYNPSSNISGLVIGRDRTLCTDLGTLPPVVILSACHSSPMGIAPVRVVDMLLREGAVAVLGTQIPVNVVHNAILMGRLFVYVAESLAGTEPHVTLLEAWCRTQSSNAVNDIANGNARLKSWLLSKNASGIPRLTDFMTNRSVGRIRLHHVYKDTEAVLIEMATAEGMGEQVARWIERPGYLPESLFYTFWGAPERVFLNYPVMLDAISSMTKQP